MARTTTKGIFCLEGDWDTDLRKRPTVGPVLTLLEDSHSPPVRFVRRDIGTRAEFEYYLKKWSQRRYARYPILYLAFHGNPGVLHLGDPGSEPVDLDWLEERLMGRCKGRVIHFGSCGTMATHGLRLRRFLNRTGALAVCGYKTDVNWMRSTAFELILLSGFQMNAFTRSGMQAVNRRVRREAANLARGLDFRMVVALAVK